MPTTCPKCSYVRTPADTAPDWQCPKCGIAMARYIELQKEKADRDLPPLERPQSRDVLKPDAAYGLPGEIASAMVRKVVAVVVSILAALLVRFLLGQLGLLRSTPPPSPPPQQSEADNIWARAAGHQAGVGRIDTTGPQPGVQPGLAVPSASAESDNLPVAAIKELFEIAQRRGEVDGFTMPEATTTNVPGMDRTRALNVHVERREALEAPGCARFGITLAQGGQGGAAGAVHFVYSLNYCVDGSVPAAGRDIKVEARS